MVYLVRSWQNRRCGGNNFCRWCEVVAGGECVGVWAGGGGGWGGVSMVRWGGGGWWGFVDGWGGFGGRAALISEGETLSYGELAARVTAEVALVGVGRRLVLIE